MRQNCLWTLWTIGLLLATAVVCQAQIVAGTGTSGFSGDGGPATSAQLQNPTDIAVDAAGNLYIADTGNFRIRKVTADGVINTIAGNGVVGPIGDGRLATSAALGFLSRIAVDAAGNLYIADTFPSVRKVTTDGVINKVAGAGQGFSGDGGPATSARFYIVSGLAVDAAGNLYIADANNNTVRKVTAGGVISTFAGIPMLGIGGFSGDGGPATAAQLNGPNGLAVDAAGNLYIADNGNNRVRKVTADGVISTVAGTGTQGSSGDGGPATSAQLNGAGGLALDAAGNLYIVVAGSIRKVTASGVISTVTNTDSLSTNSVAVDAAGNLYFSDADSSRVRKVTPGGITQSTTSFSIANRGGISLVSSGTSPSTTVGYGVIQPSAGSTAPAGVAIFGFRQNNVLVTEAGVQASPLLQSGRIYAEVNGPVNTGLAIANPNSLPATISFFFTNSSGNFGNGTTTIPANGQIAAFLNQSPFNGGSSVSGAFTFNSSAPIAVIALRGLTNERGEFLITTLPVADLTAADLGTLVFPDFADGGGWTTQVVLVNRGDSVLTGTVQFLNPSGAAATVTVNGQTNSSFPYSIPARSSQKLQTSGAGTAILSGSVRAVPATNTASPTGLAIFSFRNRGITVAEAGVTAVPPSFTAFRLYVETAGVFSTVGSIQTGLAVTNISTSAATVTLELTKLDGSSTGLVGTLSLPARGQTAIFLNQIQGFASLQTPFQGVLRVSAGSSISVIGLRGRYNERGDFLITTTPTVDEFGAALNAPLFFPHIADSGGYTTQFILFSGAPGQSSSGTLQLFSQAGSALGLALH